MVERFYERIGRPYLVDVALDWGAAGVRETFPTPVPDLSAFQPLVIYGRYSEPGRRTLRVRGRLGRRPFEQTVSIDLPAREPSNEAISRLWAREKIASLERAMHRNGQSAELVESITTTALEHHLVSQYTSFVAVDDTPAEPSQRGAPLQIAQPSEAPAGVDLRAAGGTVNGLAMGTTGFAQNMPAQPSPPVTTAMPGSYGGRADGAEESRAEYATEALAHRSGCAGCAVPARSGERRALAAFAIVAMIVGARVTRRRGTRRERAR